MPMRLKRATPIIEDDFGVCLWRMPDGAVLGDEDGRFLSMTGALDDPIVESKMKKSAVYWIGDEALLGEPLWIPGSRQISDSEADDQMENLLSGKAPDEIQAMKQKGLLDS